jgi:hypothetical protein
MKMSRMDETEVRMVKVLWRRCSFNACLVFLSVLCMGLYAARRLKKLEAVRIANQKVWT